MRNLRKLFVIFMAVLMLAATIDVKSSVAQNKSEDVVEDCTSEYMTECESIVYLGLDENGNPSALAVTRFVPTFDHAGVVTNEYIDAFHEAIQEKDIFLKVGELTTASAPEFEWLGEDGDYRLFVGKSNLAVPDQSASTLFLYTDEAAYTFVIIGLNAEFGPYVQKVVESGDILTWPEGYSPFDLEKDFI